VPYLEQRDGKPLEVESSYRWQLSTFNDSTSVHCGRSELP